MMALEINKNCVGQLNTTRKILALIGPSGSGKSSLAYQLSQQGIIDFVPSFTTRPARPDHLDHFCHRFVSKGKFDQLYRQNHIAAAFHPEGSQTFYGFPLLPDQESEAVITVILRSIIVPAIRQYIPSVVVYHIEAPWTILEQRLADRGDSKSQIDHKMAQYDHEIAQGRQLADKIFINQTNLEDLIVAVQQSLSEDVQKNHD